MTTQPTQLFSEAFDKLPTYIDLLVTTQKFRNYRKKIFLKKESSLDFQ
jgi:hypothetical protein